AYTPQRPKLHGFQREIAVTFMDCGTTLCTRAILEKSGGFDMQFNNHLAGEDGELGIRFIKAGGLMLNNPLAKRFHYLAPVGGARSSRSNVHQWRRWSRLPRPVQSLYYSGLRHFEPAAAREGMLLQWLVIGWRRRDGQAATRRWWLTTLLAEIVALPVSLYRLWVSVREARRMLDEGPQIIAIPRRKDDMNIIE
ncbi:MAG: hypothetical protein H7175_06715, partial [Burkholderiales bacterium]|nr:hypothetical protein [Anaerolineae bacterium]